MTRKTSLGARGDRVCESMGLRKHIIIKVRASLVAQMVKYLLAMQETWVRSLG